MVDKNWNRLFAAVASLMEHVTHSRVDPNEAAFCIESFLADQEQVLLAKPISELGQLSVRARKMLFRMEIETLGDLTAFSADELLVDRQCGVTTLSEIRTGLKEKNLKLRND